MIDERAVHVTGSGIDPYDVRVGERAMSHLPELLGDRVTRVALIHTQPVQRHSDHARALLRQGGYEVVDIVVPDAEAGKTVDVANGVWQRLGEEGFTRSDAIVGVGGGSGHRSGRVHRRHLDARRALRELPDLAAGDGRRVHRRQNRHQHAAGQEPGRLVLHAGRRARRRADVGLAAQRHLHRRTRRGGPNPGFIMDEENPADPGIPCRGAARGSTARPSWNRR